MSNDHPRIPSRIAPAIVTAVIAVGVVYVVFGGDPLDMSRATSPRAIARLLLILAAACVCAICAHLAIQRWFVASVVSGLAFTILAQILSFTSLGYLDPFFIITLVVGALLGFAVANVVAIPFLLVRRHRTPQ
jgi:hypothetical protein